MNHSPLKHPHTVVPCPKMKCATARFAAAHFAAARLTAALLAAANIAAALSFSSCNGNPTPDHPDTGGHTEMITDTAEPAAPLSVGELADQIAAGCTFSEELSRNDVYLDTHPFGFSALKEQLVSYAAYVPSGIIPEEVFVFEAVSTDDTAAIADKLRAYVAYQAEEYAKYAASQVPKLDDPVIVTHDTIVVYVISTDNAAAQTVVNEILN